MFLLQLFQRMHLNLTDKDLTAAMPYAYRQHITFKFNFMEFSSITLHLPSVSVLVLVSQLATVI